MGRNWMNVPNQTQTRKQKTKHSVPLVVSQASLEHHCNSQTLLLQVEEDIHTQVVCQVVCQVVEVVSQVHHLPLEDLVVLPSQVQVDHPSEVQEWVEPQASLVEMPMVACRKTERE